MINKIPNKKKTQKSLKYLYISRFPEFNYFYSLEIGKLIYKKNLYILHNNNVFS